MLGLLLFLILLLEFTNSIVSFSCGTLDILW